MTKIDPFSPEAYKDFDDEMFKPEPPTINGLVEIAERLTPESLAASYAAKNNPQNNELYLKLSKSDYLKPEKQLLFLQMTEVFVSDIKKNLFLDQFTLNEKYPDFSLDNWVEYLSDRLVAAYIVKHRKVRMKSLAEMNLLDPGSSNKRDNLRMLKELDMDGSDKNKNIVIMRIPMKEGNTQI